MKSITILLILSISSTFLYSSDTNNSKENNQTKEAVKKAMEKEKKYAKEQKFYKADEYDFKGAQVDPESLDKVPLLEPDDDFDMSTGVYD